MKRLCPVDKTDITGRRNSSGEPLQFCSKRCYRQAATSRRWAATIIAGFKRAGQPLNPQLDAKVAAIDALERGE